MIYRITTDLQHPAHSAFSIFIGTDIVDRKLSFIKNAADDMHLVAFKKLILIHHVAKTMVLAKANNLCDKTASVVTWVPASFLNLCPSGTFDDESYPSSLLLLFMVQHN